MPVILVCYVKDKGKHLYVGFMDYEKAFDFANRAEIILDLMKKGCGKFLTRAITNMFDKSTYYPKNANNRLSEGIETDYSVTQGRKSSVNLFSFYVSGMHAALNDINTDDFMDPLNDN